MKKAFIYSAIVLLAAGTACNKTDSVLPGDGQIRFALTSPETRALVENVTDLQNNQTIKVFDFLDGTNYFDADETVSYSSGAWNFDSGKGYTWKTGSHRFFAYTKDNACAISGTVVTVSKTLTTAEANQADIVYSGLNVTKTSEEAKADNYAPVRLNMDHLFSAVSMLVKNGTTDAITVNSVSANIPNKGTATLDFTKPAEGDDATKVTYGEVSLDGQYVVGTALSNVEVAAEGLVDVLGQGSATAETYWLVWPQTIAEDAVSVTVSYTQNESSYSKVVKIPAIAWKAGNKYSYTLTIYPNDVRLVFQVMPWDAMGVDINSESGSINMSNVTWQNTVVTLNQGTASETTANTLNNSAYSVYMYHNASVQVFKRNSDGELIHQVYAEDTVGADGEEHQAGEPVVDEYGNPTVYEMEWKTYDYYPAQGYFTVNYPKEGKYRIGLIPAYGQTTVNEEMYEIYIYDLASKKWEKHNQTDGESISNKTVYFQVRASENVADTHPEYRAQIDIWFKADGSDEWVSGYSEIRANYACIIPAVN